MMVRRLLVVCALACVAPGSGLAEPPLEDPAVERVRAALATVPLIDGHNDAPWAIRSRFANHLDGFDFRDTTRLDPPMHSDLSRLRAGMVGGQFWSVWVPTELVGGDAVTAVLEQIDLVHRLAGRYPEELEIALTAADVRRIHAAGRIASLIGVEGGHSIDDSLAVLRLLYGAGARYMTLTHWESTAWADSATAPPRLGGLSAFGEAVVREMNRLGMLVDLSHVSADGVRDALAVSQAPVIFSHSSAAAVNPHPRNVPDELLRLLPANGGVVMVNFGAYFISRAVAERTAAAKAEEARLQSLYPGDPERVEREHQEWLDAHPVPEVTVGELADHIDHIREVAGIDHVGLGSDYDGVSSLPEGLGDVTGYPILLAELVRRGYSAEEIAKVAGGNLLRVMEQAERAAAELGRSSQPSDLRIEDVVDEAAHQVEKAAGRGD